MENSIRKNLFWDYLNKFDVTIFSLITTAILARILTPKDCGIVGIAIAVNGIASIFLNLGFVSAIIQEKELDNKKLSTVLYLYIFISVIIYTIIFLTAPLVSNFYKLENLTLILRVTAISFLINSLNIVGLRFHQKKQITSL